ncbi:hypothetical protein [Nonomuraea jabiensis]|uniref:hypothetical protein n=1 Tax=Nonomuraea jabiensis TaxID=882448 RepID=UPI0036895E18
MNIAGVHLPKGRAVGMAYQASGVDPVVYGESANEFGIAREQTGDLGVAQL